MHQCSLRDIGYEGDTFTWRNHGKELQTYICERLDRATTNEQWCEKFPRFVVVNGEPWHSDHRPVIACTEGAESNWSRGDSGFIFEARCLQEEGCTNVIREAWNESGRGENEGVAQTLRSVAGELTKWNKEAVGELKAG